MSQILSVPRELAVKAFGTVWLADDFGGGGRIIEHLGTRKHALHFGETFPDLASACAARPTYEVIYLADSILMPNVTPIPLPRTEHSGNVVPREIFTVEFDDILDRGLRVTVSQIVSVEFEFPPAHLMGKVDFVVGAVIAGDQQKYRVLVEYDQNLGLNIVESPMVLSERGSYAATGQVLAFFREEDAAREADRFAAGLVKAADWRARSLLAAA
jgi:hypothetical protein